MTVPRADSVDRLVVRPPNWLGDAVLAIPAMAAIRRHFAKSHLTIAAAPSVAPIFREDTPVAPDRVLELPATTRAAVAVLEGEGFGLGILFPNSFRSAWQFRRAGIPERWGYSRSGRGLLLTRRPRPRRDPSRPHQADYYRALVRAFDIACDDNEEPRLIPRAPSLERASALLAQCGVVDDGPLLGFAPGAAYGQAKQWPPDRVAEVMAALIRRRRARCLIVGASHDRATAREIESWLRAHAPDAVDRVTNLTGRTSLSALTGLVHRTHVFVSNDSGAMHVAAALGRPVVATFGPTNERATSPIGLHTVLTEPVFCRPCMLRECPIDHRCMRRISADRVVEAVERVLAAAGAV